MGTLLVGTSRSIRTSSGAKAYTGMGNFCSQNNMAAVLSTTVVLPTMARTHLSLISVRIHNT
ncbi:hypothetical protein NHF46_09685 [Arthrobacter alpinus]|nr:hypothetical protein [Arthrobacter alpinus]